MYQKLKGIVRNHTFAHILNGTCADYRKNAVDVVYIKKGRLILYTTKKAQFIAERKGAKYWKIYQVIGDEN